MSRHSERGVGIIAVIVAGLVVLGLAAAFVVWVVGDDSNGEAACAVCAAAETGDVAAVRAALAAIGDAEQRRDEATQAVDPALERLEIEGGTDAREMVLALLEGGADANQSIAITGGGLGGRSGRPGNTVSGVGGGTAYVLYAAERVAGLGDLPLVERFIAAGLDVTGTPGGAVLTTAAGEGHLEIVRRLIALGANVNHRHDNLGSPLAAAVHGRHRDVAALLDQHDAREW